MPPYYADVLWWVLNGGSMCHVSLNVSEMVNLRLKFAIVKKTVLKIKAVCFLSLKLPFSILLHIKTDTKYKMQGSS